MGHGRGSARRVLRSWFIVFCSGLKVGTAEPRGGSGWRLAVGNTDEAAVENRKSIEMRAPVRERTAGDSRPYLRRRSREGEAVGGWRWEIQTRQLGQHAVLPLPSRQADASPTRPYLDTADAMSSYPYPASQPITDASSSPTARRQEGQTRVKGISGWRLAIGNTTEADPSCAR